MKTFRFALALVSLVPLVLACGGTTGTTTSTALTDAVPRYDALALDASASDVSAGTSVAAAPTGTSTALTISDLCHPHLFLRTDAVAIRTNRHLYKFLALVEAVIQGNPTLASSGSVTWERPRGTLDVKFTVERSASDANVYKWLLEARPLLSPAASFTTILTGTIDRTGATAPGQGSGSLALDLTALHSVQPLEPASGVIRASFAVTAASRTIAYDASGVTWDSSGITDGLLAATPRAAQYVYTRQPGKGGSLTIRDQMPFSCPSNPTSLAADVSLVARWYVVGGSVHGRSDALMTGGQLPAGNRVVGVTCSQSATVTGDLGEAFWLMKEEDTTTGATVPGIAFTGTVGLSPCDPAFGATVPSLTDASNDFDFSKVDFTAPYPFPGM